jgi:hypothetical protein
MSEQETTAQGEAALEEFGFLLAEPQQVGAPTPTRIADRLADIADELGGALSPRPPGVG